MGPRKDIEVAPHLELRHHDAAETLRFKDAILNVYRTSHEQPIRNDPWFGEDKFWERLVALYAPGRDFTMVSGWLGGEMIGYAFGSPRDNAASTWKYVREGLPEFPIADFAEPIYIFREFAVHPDHQGRGYGRKIHDELLGNRPERLACLYVRTDNIKATGAYLSWGWTKIGSEQPFPDSPTLHIMARVLPLHASSKK
jgi:GNAT superfamily N-acetyltransferase